MSHRHGPSRVPEIGAERHQQQYTYFRQTATAGPAVRCGRIFPCKSSTSTSSGRLRHTGFTWRSSASNGLSFWGSEVRLGGLGSSEVRRGDRRSGPRPPGPSRCREVAQPLPPRRSASSPSNSAANAICRMMGSTDCRSDRRSRNSAAGRITLSTQACFQLGHKTRLAHARLGGNQHHPPVAGLRLRPAAEQQLHLLVAADQRRGAGSAAPRTGSRARGFQTALARPAPPPAAL